MLSHRMPVMPVLRTNLSNDRTGCHGTSPDAVGEQEVPRQVRSLEVEVVLIAVNVQTHVACLRDEELRFCCR